MGSEIFPLSCLAEQNYFNPAETSDYPETGDEVDRKPGRSCDPYCQSVSQLGERGENAENVAPSLSLYPGLTFLGCRPSLSWDKVRSWLGLALSDHCPH